MEFIFSVRLPSLAGTSPFGVSFGDDEIFLDVLEKALQRLEETTGSRVSIDSIAVQSNAGVVLSLDDVMVPAKLLFARHGPSLTLVDRAGVNGPFLSRARCATLESMDVQEGAVASKVQPLEGVGDGSLSPPVIGSGASAEFPSTPGPVSPPSPPPPRGASGTGPPPVKEKKWLPGKVASGKKKPVKMMVEEEQDDMPRTFASGPAHEGKESNLMAEEAALQGEMACEGAAKTYNKNIALEYFDYMNPDNYYPLVVDISDAAQASKAAEINLLTGERKIQRKSEFTTELTTPIVVVRPIFPGCAVTPLQLMADFDKPVNKLTFYITPLVKGKVEGFIEFENEGRLVNTVPAPANIKDPNTARLVALYGGIGSFAPKILEWIGIDLGSSLDIQAFLPFLAGIPGDVTISTAVIVLGVLSTMIGSLVYYFKLKSGTAKIRYHLLDFK